MATGRHGALRAPMIDEACLSLLVIDFVLWLLLFIELRDAGH